MQVGVWDADWIGEPKFERFGADELVKIEGQEVATIHKVESNLFRYSSAFGILSRSNREACIVAGLQNDGYTVFD